MDLTQEELEKLNEELTAVLEKYGVEMAAEARIVITKRTKEETPKFEAIETPYINEDKNEGETTQTNS